MGCVSQTKYAYGARVAVGLKTATRRSLDVAVSKKDLESVTRLEKEKTLAKEWEGLRTLFAKNDTFLISHHRNHYASIYALRESVEVCESVCETSGLDDGARKEKTERKNQYNNIVCDMFRNLLLVSTVTRGNEIEDFLFIQICLFSLHCLRNHLPTIAQFDTAKTLAVSLALLVQS